MSALEQDAIPEDQHRLEEVDPRSPDEDSWGIGKEGLLWVAFASLQVVWLVLLARFVVGVV